MIKFRKERLSEVRAASFFSVFVRNTFLFERNEHLVLKLLLEADAYFNIGEQLVTASASPFVKLLISLKKPAQISDFSGTQITHMAGQTRLFNKSYANFVCTSLAILLHSDLTLPFNSSLICD